jgi:hypothetical protein
MRMTGLRAFPVGEVTGGVTNGEAIIGGHVTSTEARPAEAGLKEGTGLHQLGLDAILNQL